MSDLKKLSVNNLRTLCNQHGISCMNNGKYVPKSQLIKKIQSEGMFPQAGGSKKFGPYPGMDLGLPPMPQSQVVYESLVVEGMDQEIKNSIRAVFHNNHINLNKISIQFVPPRVRGKILRVYYEYYNNNGELPLPAATVNEIINSIRDSLINLNAIIVQDGGVIDRGARLRDIGRNLAPIVIDEPQYIFGGRYDQLTVLQLQQIREYIKELAINNGLQPHMMNVSTRLSAPIPGRVPPSQVILDITYNHGNEPAAQWAVVNNINNAMNEFMQ